MAPRRAVGSQCPPGSRETQAQGLPPASLLPAPGVLEAPGSHRTSLVGMPHSLLVGAASAPSPDP